jgi:hypothetical protein
MASAHSVRKSNEKKTYSQSFSKFFSTAAVRIRHSYAANSFSSKEDEYYGSASVKAVSSSAPIAQKNSQRGNVFGIRVQKDSCLRRNMNDSRMIHEFLMNNNL